LILSETSGWMPPGEHAQRGSSHGSSTTKVPGCAR
jgi:hypothetical protein